MTKIWPCVVLGIDAGSISGYALLGPEANLHIDSGTTRAGDYVQRAEVCEMAAEVAEAYGLPLCVAREDWGGRRAVPRFDKDGKPIGSDLGDTARMMAGLGRAWGNWQEAIRIALQRRTFIEAKIHPMTWWSTVIGGKKPKREQAEARSKVAMSQRFGVDVESPDLAAALGIAATAQVHKKIGPLMPATAWHIEGPWLPCPIS